jgi:hypothetical protein
MLLTHGQECSRAVLAARAQARHEEDWACVSVADFPSSATWHVVCRKCCSAVQAP